MPNSTIPLLHSALKKAEFCLNSANRWNYSDLNHNPSSNTGLKSGIFKIKFSIPSKIEIICSEHRDYTGMKAVVIGWGRTSESKPPSNEMRKVVVPIMSVEDCRQNSGYVSSRITDNMMCAGYHEGQKDSCQVQAS